jgi:hypothetical protein
VARNFLLDDEEKDHHPMTTATTSQQAFLLNYIGPLQTARDVAGTLLQYYLRLFLTGVTPRQERLPLVRPFPHVPEDFVSQVVPRPLEKWEHLKTYWIQEVWPLLPHVAASVQHLPGGVSPKWSPRDYAYIQWLLQEDEGGAEGEEIQQTDNNDNKKMHLFVQCQSPTTDSILLDHYSVFAEIAWILSSRRDTWFLALDNCDDNSNEPLLQPAQVAVYSFWWNQPATDLNWTIHALSPRPSDPSQDNNHNNKNDVDPHAAAKHGLRRFLIRHATPAVLWFDRYATASIAFADDYEIHFLFLINLHDDDVSNNDNDTNQRNYGDRQTPDLKQLLQTFHQECTHLKHQAGHNAISLIMPSTETRSTTTLGIDFWTPLDRWATSAMDDNKTSQQRHQVPQSSFSNVDDYRSPP